MDNLEGELCGDLGGGDWMAQDLKIKQGGEQRQQGVQAEEKFETEEDSAAACSTDRRWQSGATKATKWQARQQEQRKLQE